jgi:hypothetical protein
VTEAGWGGGGGRLSREAGQGGHGREKSVERIRMDRIWIWWIRFEGKQLDQNNLNGLGVL